MNSRTSRRHLLKASLALPVTAVGSSSRATRLPGASSASAEEPRLTVAMLDSHWSAVSSLVDQFTSERRIEIEPKTYAYGELYSQLNLALTQQAPTFDVVSISDPWMPQFASFLVPIMVTQKEVDTFVPVAVSLGRYPESSPFTGMPWLGEAQFFGFHRDWLDGYQLQPPETWVETVDSAEMIAAEISDDSDRWALAITSLTEHDLVDSFLPILRGFGKEMIDPATSVPQLETPEALSAIVVFERLAALSPVETGAADEIANTQRFEQATVAMMANFWSSGMLDSRIGESSGESVVPSGMFQPAEVPVPRLSMTEVWMLGIPIGSLLPDQALAFVEWLVSTDVQSQLPSSGLPPTLTATYADDELVAAYPELPMLHDFLASATPRPRSPFYPQLEMMLGTELKNVLSGKKSGSTALKDANIGIRAFLVREGVIAS